MRVLFIVLALMLACGATALAADESATSNDSTMTESSDSSATAVNPSGQAMVDACLSRCLNVSPKQISDLRAQGLSDPDIAIACAIAAKSTKPVGDVVAKYQSCKDWKQVAGGFNLSMADLMSAPVSSSADCEAFNTAFFSQYYSIPRSQIAQVRRQGCSWDDVNVYANAALSTNQSITQIASLRKQGTSWEEIAARYSVAKDTITNPVKMTLVSTAPMYSTPAATGTGDATCPAPCPAACPAPCPPPCPTVCPAGPSSCCGNGPCQACDGEGRVILNYNQVMDLYRNGHDWLDVAIAINIKRYTGYPIAQILSDLKSLGTWQLTLTYYGVPENYAYNVADYPFPRNSSYNVGVDMQHSTMLAKYQKPGTWPTCARGNPVCPGGVGAGVTVVPVPCPNPCGTGPVCPTTPTVPCPCPTQ